MKKIDITITKLLLCIIIFLVLAILTRQSTSYKERIKYELFENHLSYTKFKNIYNKYLGGYMPLKNITLDKEKPVFDEKISYKNLLPYENGVKISVEKNYLVPSQDSGVIVYIGEKEKYNNVIIIEGKNDIDIWYGNICNSKYKLYDYVEKGTYIGESCDESIYLVYSKNNKFLDYKSYLS